MSLDIPGDEGYVAQGEKPSRSGSAPYETPLRHHQRKPSTPRQVKETLHAVSEWSNSGDDGAAVHRINQYVIGEEIGRGSFGAVHLAADQYGNEYAVKEFSKSRLRKRAQSNILRRPHGPGRGFFSPQNSRIMSRSPAGSGEQLDNPLYLIREEIAIMKKLNHPNLVGLLEVLDDPEEDSLYMVLEMCKKGVIMKVGMHEPADPYDSESCRCWFRDLLLGIEYLHAQGVAHRDIKPDNLLLNDDDELKIVDFGVSEMFEKSDLLSTKSAGSPAFLPPELCVAKHGNVSGRAADIWSMGVTLYCLYFGSVPFEQTNILDLYKSICQDEPKIPDDTDPEFKDLMAKILEKDPVKRIKMEELREHPWVTKDGLDPLMTTEANVATIVDPPTEEEVNRAITKNMGNLLAVVKAVKQFKRLVYKRGSSGDMEGILGPGSHMVQPPLQIERDTPQRVLGSAIAKIKTSRADVPSSSKRPAEDYEILASPDILASPTGISGIPDPETAPSSTAPSRSNTRPSLSNFRQRSDPRLQSHRSGTVHEGRGQAHDPLMDTVYLGLGAHGIEDPSAEAMETDDPSAEDPPMISESPSADDTNIYELAYQAEINRIRREKGRHATVYLTRRVDALKESLRERDSLREGIKDGLAAGGAGGEGFRQALGISGMGLKESLKEGAQVGREVGRDIGQELSMDIFAKSATFAGGDKGARFEHVAKRARDMIGEAKSKKDAQIAAAATAEKEMQDSSKTEETEGRES